MYMALWHFISLFHGPCRIKVSLAKHQMKYFSLDVSCGLTLWELSSLHVGKKEQLVVWIKMSRWSEAIYCAHYSSACANHNEQYQKLLNRWYFAPLRLARAYPMASPYCWRSCGSVGTLLHIFWTWSLLRPFWDAILALISSIIIKLCPATPEFALLLIRIENIPPSFRTIVCNILHAAHLTVARYWKSNLIPNLLEVNAIVSDIYLYERTLAWHRGASSSFQSTWSLWRALHPSLTWSFRGRWRARTTMTPHIT